MFKKVKDLIFRARFYLAVNVFFPSKYPPFCYRLIDSDRPEKGTTGVLLLDQPVEVEIQDGRFMAVFELSPAFVEKILNERPEDVRAE